MSRQFLGGKEGKGMLIKGRACTKAQRHNQRMQITVYMYTRYKRAVNMGPINNFVGFLICSYLFYVGTILRSTIFGFVSR